MQLLVLRKGTLIELSVAPHSPVPPSIIDLVDPHLQYTYKKLLRGPDAYDSRTGGREGMEIRQLRLYKINSEGYLDTGFGFLPKLAGVLGRAGHDVRFHDITPPAPDRPLCYELDWQNVWRHNVQFRPRQMDAVLSVVNNPGGIINAPTGFGKTWLLYVLALLYPHAKIAVVVKSVEVAEKIVRRLTAVMPNVGFVSGKGKKRVGRLTVYTAGSMHHCDGDVDFLFADECVTGDADIATPAGTTKLKNVIDGDEVLCYDGQTVQVRRVTKVWARGVRTVMRLTLADGRTIRCTANHRIQTQRGWLPADKLLLADQVLCLAPAGAARCLVKVSGAGNTSLQKGTGPAVRGPRGNGFMPQSSPAVFCAPVAAARTCRLWLRAIWSNLFCAGGLRAARGTSQGIAVGLRSTLTGLLCPNDRQCSVRSSGTPISVTQTAGVGILDSPPTTGARRRRGRDTKPRNYAVSAYTWICGQTAASVQRLFAASVVAFRRCVRYIPWCIRAMQPNVLHARGSIRSDWKGSPGGFAMTVVARAPAPCGCIPRATIENPSYVRRPGSSRNTAQLVSATAVPAAGRFTSPESVAMPSEGSESMSPHVWPTSYVPLQQIEKLAHEEDVFDIEVEEHHNFFANGVLVHNCHQLMSPKHSEDIARVFRRPRCYGFSATPDGRMDGAGAKLECFFGPQIFQMTYAEAVVLGLVVPICVNWLLVPAIDGRNPAFNKTGVPKMRWGIWRNQDRNAIIARDARLYSEDTQVLINVATFDHAVHLWQCLPEYQLCYAAADTNRLEDIEHYKRNNLLPGAFRPVTPDIRYSMQRDFEANRLKRVIATDVWSTGVDFEQLQVFYNISGRQSEILDVQGPGRTSRVYEGKEYGEVKDCIDLFDKGLKRKTDERRRHYKVIGWEDNWPAARRNIGVL